MILVNMLSLVFGSWPVQINKRGIFGIFQKSKNLIISSGLSYDEYSIRELKKYS